MVCLPAITHCSLVQAQPLPRWELICNIPPVWLPAPSTLYLFLLHSIFYLPASLPSSCHAGPLTLRFKWDNNALAPLELSLLFFSSSFILFSDASISFRIACISQLRLAKESPYSLKERVNYILKFIFVIYDPYLNPNNSHLHF